MFVPPSALIRFTRLERITRFAHRLKAVGITLCASAEGDDVESIFAVKILQDVSKRVFRLRNFLPCILPD